MVHLPLTAVLLAGGRGERLGGVIKPLLRLPSGLTILEVIERELAPIVERVVVVAPEVLAPPLRAVVSGELVYDRRDGPARALLDAAVWLAERRAGGPVASPAPIAAAGVGEGDEPWILAVGADHPRPSRALVHRLWSAIRPGDGAVWVVEDDVAQGMYALYREGPLVALSAAPDPPRSLRALGHLLGARELDARVLPAEERAALSDVDTPEDLRAFGLERPEE